MNTKYILDKDHNPVLETNLIKWAKWFENHTNRIVARTSINGLCVSTVFLGLDHSFGFEGSPVLFETMIFHENKKVHLGYFNKDVKEFLDFQERYCTWDEALQGHNEAVEKVRQGTL